MAYQLDIKNIPCLSSEEAAAILKKEGFNELPSGDRYGFLALFWHTIKEPMFLLLLIGATIYFILGSKQDALLLLTFVVFIISITFFQEHKSEKALLALRNLSSPRAFVLRDKKGKRIFGREVVRKDIIVINEGDRVPADAVLILENNLLVDESILTGESLPVSKKAIQYIDSINEMQQPGGDDTAFVFSGTYVTQGKGIAKVLATGVNTGIGKIGQGLKNIQTERTLLQKETDSLVRSFALWGVILCLLVAVIYGILRANWLNGFLAGIALAMAILPEEFPVVLTVFLGLGAWRISLKHVLTRRAAAIEALGSATVLCVDKTGTITQNRMSVAKLYADGEYYVASGKNNLEALPEIFHQLVEYGILASQRDPFDPMERAIKALGEHHLKHSEHLHDNWQLIRQYPLAKELLAISLVWKSNFSEDFIIATKGAPETIFDLCHLEQSEINRLSQVVRGIADEGLRVLGVAKAHFKKTDLPKTQHDFDFEFLGFIGLADPVRPNISAAVEDCHTAGIRVIMLTGDYSGTAQNIAKQIGLNGPDRVITGPELSSMSDDELMQRIKNTNIFARIIPEQKLRIVNALKANHEIVAMTGDGVNDAPALKAAHIGVAMGERGTDVARESASLVLLDDDFSSIVAAIKLGRRIFDNIKKAVVYLLAAHLPIIGLSLLPIVYRWPLILLPVHIVFLELIIDPTCSIVFEAEAEEKNIMHRKPRKPQERLFNSRTFTCGMVQGLSVFLVVAAIFIIFKYINFDEATTRTMAFTTLIFSNFALIFANRANAYDWKYMFKAKNIALWWVLGGALVALLGILYIPFLRELFYFSKLSWINLLISAATGLGILFWLRYVRRLTLSGQTLCL